jgi:hypothetical protein
MSGGMPGIVCWVACQHIVVGVELEGPGDRPCAVGYGFAHQHELCACGLGNDVAPGSSPLAPSPERADGIPARHPAPGG